MDETRTMQKRLDELERILRDQLALHDQLLDLLRRKRGAVVRAEQKKLEDLCRQEHETTGAIMELEKKRLTLTAELSLAVEPGAAEPLRLGPLAERLDEPMKGQLLMLRHQLRERMEEVRREASVAQRATEALVRHVQGLVQAVSTAWAGVGVYGREGMSSQRAVTVSTFSMTA